MYPFRRKLLINAFKLFDLLNMSMCLILSVFVFSNKVTLPSFSQIGLIEIKILNLVFFIILLLTWKLIFVNFKLYHSKRLSEQSKEISDVLKATSIGALLILIEALFFRINFITIPVIFFFWLCCTTITITSRFVLRYILRRIRIYGRNLRHVLIIGTNPRAIQFTEKILASPEFGYLLVGFADNEWAGVDKFRKNKYQLVCDLDNFQTFIRNNVVDEVIVALPLKSFYDQASQLISICEEQGIIVRYLSSIFDGQGRKMKIKEFENYSLIPLFSDTIYGFPAMAKRIMDIVLSFVILTISIPIFIFVPIANKLTSRGPVFFTQERVGLGKRKFRLYKFRTMSEDAEKKLVDLEDQNEVSGPVFKIKDDPRITSVGKYLRKFSIDELPQLFNVLKGDMSIVGPRPLPIRDYNGFSVDWHRRRFSVRPGMTCLWQVEGRSNIPFEKWMELDMEYIDEWSLWLDLKILIRTIPSVLKGLGAT
jgi:exopolysaccharide biosynthesis polyprenyl glycosylphosphotransferase